MSNFEVFPPKCEVTLLKGKMFSMNKKGRNYREGVPLSSNLRNQVKELAQNYYFPEVGRRYASEVSHLKLRRLTSFENTFCACAFTATGNLVPRVLSLLRESTLVTAGHVSKHANPSRTEGESST